MAAAHPCGPRDEQKHQALLQKAGTLLQLCLPCPCHGHMASTPGHQPSTGTPLCPQGIRGQASGAAQGSAALGFRMPEDNTDQASARDEGASPREMLTAPPALQPALPWSPEPPAEGVPAGWGCPRELARGSSLCCAARDSDRDHRQHRGRARCMCRDAPSLASDCAHTKPRHPPNLPSTGLPERGDSNSAALPCRNVSVTTSDDDKGLLDGRASGDTSPLLTRLCLLRKGRPL